MSAAAKAGLIAAWILGWGFLSGCATDTSVDWDARIGSYTCDQAMSELGPPDRKSVLAGGEIVAEWYPRPVGETGCGIGTGFSAGATSAGFGETTGTEEGDPALILTFTPGGHLPSWSKNY
ncbi:MAG: hypothetical protein KGR98_00745 [Verrucomicrobia bacterium]|nr:hypothetical protein [Verrucomicrobiota bacterium]